MKFLIPYKVRKIQSICGFLIYTIIDLLFFIIGQTAINLSFKESSEIIRNRPLTKKFFGVHCYNNVLTRHKINGIIT